MARSFLVKALAVIVAYGIYNSHFDCPRYTSVANLVLLIRSTCPVQQNIDN